MNGRERVLTMLDEGCPDRLPLMPITMMFAAERLGVKYHQYATDHRTLVEAQIRTAEEYDFDHVSCISDPARETADCGGVVQYFEDQPPAVDENRALLADKSGLVILKVPDPLGGGRMHDRVLAAALFKERVGSEKLIEGWVEGPCALAADLRGINTLMLDFYDDPTFVRDLFSFAVETALVFAKAQMEAGVDIVGVGDAAASLAGPRFYDEFIFPAEKKLMDGLREIGTRVRLHICGNTRPILKGMGALGCAIVDLDSMVPLDQARREMGEEQVLLGNMDPVRVLRNGTPEAVTAALAENHRQAGKRYIVGAGCEVPRDTPPENLRAMAAYARSMTAR